jgi:drug/metabolite transporter (DMT)-like permease
MTHIWGPVLGLLANAMVFGLSWWPFQAMQARGLHPLWATAFMYGLALGLIHCVKPMRLAVWREHPPLIWLFMGSGLTNLCFNWAVTQGDVVRVVLLFYTMPAWSIVLAWWLLQERPGRGSLIRLALAILGVSLVLKTPDTPWPMPQSLNDYLALAGGAGFALNNVMLRKLSFLPESDRMVAMFSGGTVMTAMAAWVCMPLGLVTFPTDLAWWPYALGLALCILCSNLSLQYGAARLPAHTTALVMLSEIVFATVSSVALGVASLDGRKTLGGLLIVSAAILATIDAGEKESA